MVPSRFPRTWFGRLLTLMDEGDLSGASCGFAVIDGLMEVHW